MAVPSLPAPQPAVNAGFATDIAGIRKRVFDDKVSTRWLKTQTATGKIPSVKIGGRRLYVEEQVKQQGPVARPLPPGGEARLTGVGTSATLPVGVSSPVC